MDATAVSARNGVNSRRTKLTNVFVCTLLVLLSRPPSILFRRRNLPTYASLTTAVAVRADDKRLNVNVNSIKHCKWKLVSTTLRMDYENIPQRHRIIIVYHIGFLGPGDSLQVNADNVRTFLTSLHENELQDSTFIIINVSGGVNSDPVSSANERNALEDVVDAVGLSSELSCKLAWSFTKSDLLTHALTVGVLQDELYPFFGTFIFLNNGMRGPLARRTHWVQHFVDHLRSVALTGPVLSCEIHPHVPTPMFAFSDDLVEMFLKVELGTQESESWRDVILKREIGLSRAVVASGKRIGSLLHKSRWNETFFDGNCRPELGNGNVSHYCEAFFTDSLFVKYGGEFYRQGLFCKLVVREVEAATKRILGSTS